MFKRSITYIILIIFFFGEAVTPCRAQLSLPNPGMMVPLSPVVAPPLLKGVKVYPSDPFKFDFVLDQGDPAGRPYNAIATQDERASVIGKDWRRGDPLGRPIKDDANRLVKYFLASLTIPEKDMWVNLSPYEKDRIVPKGFGQTEMGRDLLAEDYLLKQITASAIYPEGDIGKAFWKKVYAAAQEKYGTIDIPVDTFNKVWVVPEKAEVYESGNAAYVTRAKLKVMLETDYVAMQHDVVGALHATPLQPDSSYELTKNILREIIIPILEKEVNEGENFIMLRQVYNSLILATWYKRKMMNALSDVRRGDPSGRPQGANNPMQYYIDHQKTVGVDIPDKNEKEKIWAQYVEAFKKGVFNFVRDEPDVSAQKEGVNEIVPRKYFAGGMQMALGEDVFSIRHDRAQIGSEREDSLLLVKANFDMAEKEDAVVIIEGGLAGEVNKPSSMNVEGVGWSVVHGYSSAVRKDVVKPLKGTYGYSRGQQLEHTTGLANEVMFRLNDGRVVFVMGDHSHAFAFWELMRREGVIQTKGNILLHVDEHDDARLTSLPEPMDPKENSLAAVINYGTKVIDVGNFIVPFINDGLIANWFWLSAPDTKKAEKMEAGTMLGAKGYVKSSDAPVGVEDAPMDMLDIDLDVFNNTQDHPDKLIDLLARLSTKAKVITIATSPGWINQDLVFRLLETLLDKIGASTINSDQAQKEGDTVVKQSKEADPLGGIDLGGDKIDLKVRQDGVVQAVKFDMAQMKKMERAEGLIPVVLNIEPLKGLSQFLKVD